MPQTNPHQLSLTQAIEQLEQAQKNVWLRIRRLLAGMGYTTLVIVLAIVITVIAILRFYGLPTGIRDYILKELEARGISASVDRVVLDPTGGIVAEGVAVYRNPARNDLLLQVDRVRIGIAWFSRWQGKPWIQSASVANATIKYPLTEKTTIEVRQVNATVDFEPGYLQVRGAQARFLNVQLDLKGRVGLNSKLTSAPRTAEQNERIDRFWKQVIEITDDLDTEHPIRLQADFNVEMTDPQKGIVHALIDARMFRWRGALVDGLQMQASLEDQVVHLIELRLKLVRGELTLTGEANLQDKSAHADLESNLDFTPLGSALGGRAQGIVSHLNFTELPIINAHLQLGWKDPVPAINLQADVDWRRFTYDQTLFERFVLPIAFDGTRVFIPDAHLASRDGEMAVEVLYDRSKPEIKGRIDSTINPTVMKGVFGPGADRFLDSLEFRQGGPNLKLSISGQSIDPKEWLASGKASAQNFSYKNVAMDSVEADLSFTNLELDVTNLLVKRKEGQVTGEVRENFAQRWVQLTNLQSSVLVQEADVILGDKFVSYVKPYTLDRPPNLKVDGLVDLNDQKPKLDTDLKVQLSGQTNLSYLLFGKKMVLVNPQGEISVKDRDLNVHFKEGHLYGGPVTGNIAVKMVGKNPDYSLQLGLKEGDFKQMMTELFNNEKTSGKFDFNMNMTGKIGDLKSMVGTGDLSVEDGYLISIPLMSGLTFIVDNLIPGISLGKADHAKASFSLANGAITTKDMMMSSAIFSMLGNGSYNYVQDQLDIDMRVNISGPIGWLTGFLSRIFQAHGKGTLSHPEWGAKILGG